MAGTHHDKVRSKKHALVDKANSTMLLTIGVTSVIVVFSLFAFKALIGQYSYQNKVIKQKKATLKQVQANKKNAEQLVSSYKAFVAEPINVLGGDPKGTGPRDGDNPRIVLDALPSQYDFPGLASSLEKIISGSGLKIDGIGGTEQVPGEETLTATPVPTEMVFPIAVQASYGDVQKLITTLESSIRPIYLTRLTIEGTEATMRLSAEAKTYYQPIKTFTETKEVVK